MNAARRALKILQLIPALMGLCFLAATIAEDTAGYTYLKEHLFLLDFLDISQGMSALFLVIAIIAGWPVAWFLNRYVKKKLAEAGDDAAILKQKKYFRRTAFFHLFVAMAIILYWIPKAMKFAAWS